MNTYYTSVMLIGVSADLIMIFGVCGDKFVSSSQKKYFSLLFLLITIAGIAKWGAVSIENGFDGSRFLHIASKFAEFSISPFVPAVCASAFGRNNKLLYAAPVFNLLLQLCSLFTGCVFSIHASALFVRGALYPLYAAAFLFGTAILFWNCFNFSKKYQYNNVILLMLLGVVIFLCVVIQGHFRKINLDWTCISFAAIIFYIYYNQLVHQADDLTCLLNRKSYAAAAASLKKEAAIVFIDVNDFKKVNDNYGHIFGDESLILLSRELIKVFEKYGYCYRVGGDEFCVIMKKNIGETERLVTEYIKKIKKIREEDFRIPSVSVGYDFFKPGGDVRDTQAAADRMMYKNKKAMKKGGALGL